MTRLILDFLKFKIKLKNQEERIHFIVQQSRHRKDNASSETNIYFSEQSKKKRINSNKQNIETFAKKMVKKLLRQHL